jgi:hypothetical protein
VSPRQFDCEPLQLTAVKDAGQVARTVVRTIAKISSACPRIKQPAARETSRWDAAAGAAKLIGWNTIVFWLGLTDGDDITWLSGDPPMCMLEIERYAINSRRF